MNMVLDSWYIITLYASCYYLSSIRCVCCYQDSLFSGRQSIVLGATTTFIILCCALILFLIFWIVLGSQKCQESNVQLRLCVQIVFLYSISNQSPFSHILHVYKSLTSPSFHNSVAILDPNFNVVKPGGRFADGGTRYGRTCQD